MNRIEFREMVKAATAKRKDDAVFQMLKNDTVYNEDSKREGDAEQRYLQLALTREQKAVCDELLTCRARLDFEYSTAAYRAGIQDAFRMITVLFPEIGGLEEIKEDLFPEE